MMAKSRENYNNIPKLHAILHYVDCIRSLGSADGYNTESPERLHIDYAKDAYRASNKRDYVEQMAIWLQRREAMWLRESYLMWMDKRIPSMIKTSEDNVMEEEELEDVIEHLNQRDINMNQRDINMTQRDINITNSRDESDDKLNFRYSLAKQPPHKNLTVEKLTQHFGTTNFLPALSTFIRQNFRGTTLTPSNRDRFDAYKQILVSLPSNRYLAERILVDRIRTAPSINASGRALEKAAHFDTALIAEDLPLYKNEGGISGDILLISVHFLLRN